MPELSDMTDDELRDAIYQNLAERQQKLLSVVGDAITRAEHLLDSYTQIENIIDNPIIDRETLIGALERLQKNTHNSNTNT